MVNINAQLPSAAAIPFHPATESLHKENLNKPVIPKTEIVSSYHKLREEQDRNQFSTDTRRVIQNENEHNPEQSESQQGSPEKRRSRFFAVRGKLAELETTNQDLMGIKDFSVVISVIQARYRNAVSPFPEPIIDRQV